MKTIGKFEFTFFPVVILAQWITLAMMIHTMLKTQDHQKWAARKANEAKSILRQADSIYKEINYIVDSLNKAHQNAAPL